MTAAVVIIGTMIRAISFVLLCAASFGAVYWVTAPSDNSDVALAPAVESANSSPATAEPQIASNGAEAIPALRQAEPAPPTLPETSAEAPHPVRNVTPDNMTAAPTVTGPLTRVEPPAAEKPAEPKKARLQRLFNPVVVSAGAIEAGDHAIRLAGISATTPDATCGDGANLWPCGRVARSALRSFIHGRAIACEVPAGSDAIPDPAHCQVGGEDIAKWLVAQGWAKRDGGDYAEEADAAKTMQLGLFSATRPDAQPDEVAARR